MEQEFCLSFSEALSGARIENSYALQLNSPACRLPPFLEISEKIRIRRINNYLHHFLYSYK